MTDALFWKIIAVLAILLLLIIAGLLGAIIMLTLISKKSIASAYLPELRQEQTKEPDDDGSPTLVAWNYMIEVNLKVTELDEPDDKLRVENKYSEFAAETRRYAVELNKLAALLHSMPSHGVDRKLVSLLTDMREWYEELSRLKCEWATYWDSLAEYERDHEGIMPIIEAAWRGATQFDLFGRGKERDEALNAILRNRALLENEAVRIEGRRELLSAEKKMVFEEYCKKWHWTSESENLELPTS